jgi:CubicO group peptidase (beta-lactamase class C family)
MDKQSLQSRLAELLEKHEVPGASVGVLHNGEVTEAAAGVINRNTGVEATTDTLFQIGSISKVWTTTVVMQLVDEGKLDLDAPVRDVIGDFAVADEDVAAKVTLRHLLSHTSGIDGDHFLDCGRGDDCLEKYVAATPTLGQTHPLGATMSYCNTGFSIAGRMIELIEEKVWDQVMRERVYAPLGLTHTNTLPEEALLFRTATGHLKLAPDQPQIVAPIWQLPRICGPMGLINSTVRDVLTFAKAHMDGGKTPDGKQLLSEASVKVMQEPQVAIPDPHTLGSQWGIGWILMDWNGARLYGHDGSTIGQGAFLRIAPDAGVAITLLTNGGNARDLYQELFTELFAELAGIAMPPMPVLPETPLEIDLAPYAGTYKRLGIELELVVDGGTLAGTATMTGPMASMNPNPVQQLTLTPVDTETFLVTGMGAASAMPSVFYDFVDGKPSYLHFGARTHPRVG